MAATATCCNGITIAGGSVETSSRTCGKVAGKRCTNMNMVDKIGLEVLYLPHNVSCYWFVHVITLPEYGVKQCGIVLVMVSVSYIYINTLSPGCTTCHPSMKYRLGQLPAATEDLWLFFLFLAMLCHAECGHWCCFIPLDLQQSWHKECSLPCGNIQKIPRNT